MPEGDASDRLFDVLEDYLESVERGAAPSRADFLAAHPDLAERLEACLLSLDFVGRAAGGPSLALPLPPGTERLGDFRLLREIGRGGMGVVYEAEQISLHRRVALKVLPCVSASDPRRLRRFHDEALASAQLNHPHIVPVHAVGSERGVHYYAMQIVEGLTLEEVVRDMRLATLDEDAADVDVPARVMDSESAHTEAYCLAVARLGIQATSALAYAHEHGVVHRDVKPSNLIVEESGHLWVADFGLALTKAAEAGVTASGDLLGTLRYMSPEQASARHDEVDARTDVYSLGATLYELLTLHQAHPEEDAPSLVRAIAEREPVPLRRLNPAIPRALEAVVMRAMAKAPDDRYATAGDLGADLRQFVDGQPVRARRSVAGRIGRALTRRPRRAAALLVLALTIPAGIAGALLLRSSARPVESGPAAEIERLRAELHEHDVVARRLESGELDALPLARRSAEIFERLWVLGGRTHVWRWSLASRRLWCAEILRNLGRPGEALADVDAALAHRRWQFEHREDGPAGDPERYYRASLATALLWRSVLLGELDHNAEAQAEARRAIELLEEVRSRMEGRVDVRPWWADLPTAYAQLARLQREAGAVPDARESLRRALGDSPPEGHLRLRQAWVQMHVPFPEMRDPKRALALAEEAGDRIGRGGSGHDRFLTHLTLGAARLRSGDPAGALQALERAVSISHGGNGFVWCYLALAQAALGNREEALSWYRRMEADSAPRLMAVYQSRVELDALRREVEAVLGDEAVVATIEADALADAALAAGMEATRRGADAEAVPHFRRHVAIRERIWKLEGDGDGGRWRLARAHGMLAGGLRNLGRLEEARGAAESLVAHREWLLENIHLSTAGSPQVECRGELASGQVLLSGVLHELGESERALAAACRARDLLRDVRDLIPTHAGHRPHWYLLPIACGLVGLLEREAGAIEASRRSYREAFAEFPAQPHLLAAQAWVLLHVPYPDLRDPERALQLVEEATRRLHVVGAAFHYPYDLLFLTARGAALHRTGEHEEAIRVLELANEVSHGGNGFTWYYLALAHAAAGDRDAALRWYRRREELSERRLMTHYQSHAELAALRREVEGLPCIRQAVQAIGEEPPPR